VGGAEDEMSEAGGGRRPSIIRFRAGFLVLLALLIVSGMAGRWVATLFSLGLGWAALIGLGVAVLVGAVLSRLSAGAYIGLAALVCAVVMYTAFDFARGPTDWSDGWAAGLALLAGLLLGAAFWDFWRLTHEVRVWAHERD
jgi:hypothetical protein